MITIADTLMPGHVKLDFVAGTIGEGIDLLTPPLRTDERVNDWAELLTALHSHPPCRVGEHTPFGICIPHARTNAVTEMVMTAARCQQDLVIPDSAAPIRYIFCIGVPKAMAADYLRIAGVLMRIFTDEETEESLRTATSSTQFVAALTRLERKL